MLLHWESQQDFIFHWEHQSPTYHRIILLPSIMIIFLSEPWLNWFAVIDCTLLYISKCQHNDKISILMRSKLCQFLSHSRPSAGAQPGSKKISAFQSGTYSQRFDQLRKYVSTHIFLSQSQRIMMDRKFCSYTSWALPYQESLNSITVRLSTIIYISTTNPANQVFVQREIYHYQKFQ